MPIRARRTAGGRTASILGVAIGLAVGSAARAQAPITSTFTSDAEGWTQTGATLLEQQGSGGNPDGFLYIDNSEGPITYVFAPGGFLGDLSAYDGGTFSIDANMLGIGGAGRRRARR